MKIVKAFQLNEGKKIFPGMFKAREISPNVVQKEDNGYILGRVTFIFDYPATDELLMQNLAAAKLCSQSKRRSSVSGNIRAAVEFRHI